MRTNPVRVVLECLAFSILMAIGCTVFAAGFVVGCGCWVLKNVSYAAIGLFWLAAVLAAHGATRVGKLFR